MASISLELILSICLTLPILILSQQPHLTIYDSAGQSREINYPVIDDLNEIGWNDRIVRVCVKGIWNFYDHKYEGNMYYAVGHRQNNTCYDIANSTSSKLSSIRYAGSPIDISVNSITFYTGTWFRTKDEAMFTDERKKLAEEMHKSIIITGTESWTVYDKHSFEGESLCLVPQNNRKYVLITDIDKLNENKLNYNTVKSVRKGCHSSNKLALTSSSYRMGSVGNEE